MFTSRLVGITKDQNTSECKKKELEDKTSREIVKKKRSEDIIAEK